MNIAIQTILLTILGGLIGATQSSQIEKRLVFSHKKLWGLYDKLYAPKFSWWRVAVGVPIVTVVFGLAGYYIYWLSLQTNTLPIQTNIVIYIFSGFIGFHLRKKLVVYYVQKYT
ncbi:hypothetical protein [Aurantivibrio infirmus]